MDSARRRQAYLEDRAREQRHQRRQALDFLCLGTRRARRGNGPPPPGQRRADEQRGENHCESLSRDVLALDLRTAAHGPDRDQAVGGDRDSHPGPGTTTPGRTNYLYDRVGAWTLSSSPTVHHLRRQPMRSPSGSRRTRDAQSPDMVSSPAPGTVLAHPVGSLWCMTDGVVIFDGDDTLWETEILYDEARDDAAALVATTGIDRESFVDLQRQIDVRNVARLGLTKERFPTSSVEAYRELAGRRGDVASDTIAERGLPGVGIGLPTTRPAGRRRRRGARPAAPAPRPRAAHQG